MVSLAVRCCEAVEVQKGDVHVIIKISDQVGDDLTDSDSSQWISSIRNSSILLCLAGGWNAQTDPRGGVATQEHHLL